MLRLSYTLRVNSRENRFYILKITLNYMFYKTYIKLEIIIRKFNILNLNSNKKEILIKV